MDFYSEIGGHTAHDLKDAARAIEEESRRPVTVKGWPLLDWPEGLQSPPGDVVVRYRITAPDNAVLDRVKPSVERMFSVAWKYWHLVDVTPGPDAPLSYRTAVDVTPPDVPT